MEAKLQRFFWFLLRRKEYEPKWTLPLLELHSVLLSTHYLLPSVTFSQPPLPAVEYLLHLLFNVCLLDCLFKAIFYGRYVILPAQPALFSTTDSSAP